MKLGKREYFGHDVMMAYDLEARVLWLKTKDVAVIFGMSDRNMREHLKDNIPVTWQKRIHVGARSGTQDAPFINQSAIVKLSILSRKPEAKHFADEIIELGIRAKNGDLALIDEIVEHRMETGTDEDVDDTEHAVQRVQAKVSNKIRNRVVEARTQEGADRVETIKHLAGRVNKVTTGRYKKEIVKIGGAKETRDNLSPAQLALQRFVELSQVEMMELHDAEGYNRISQACGHLHEETADYAERLGLHDQRHIRNRTHSKVRGKPPQQELGP